MTVFKVLSLFFCCLFSGLMSAEVIYTRTALWGGFDGKMCKVQPTVATDGTSVALMTFQKLLLSGSDVFYGQFVSKSVDGGVTWSEPRQTTGLPDEHVGEIRITKYATVHYHRKSRSFFALGIAAKYKGDKVPYHHYAPNDPYAWPLLVKVDAETGDFIASERLSVPFDYELCYPFGQTVELENGDLLVPFYYRPIGSGMRSKCVVIRFAFNGGTLKPVATGTPVALPALKRGCGEPSLVRFGEKFLLTLRSDEYGSVAESRDGLHFSVPKKWTWEDGTPIGNANTQQHWVPLGDKLYLSYTRATPANGHVFRNRAPIFISEVDVEKVCLKRTTEKPVVPDRGARLGNFCVASGTNGDTWLLTAEWMQPRGCENHGSDNSLWLVKLRERAPRNRGALVLTFDDRHIDHWRTMLPLFDRYGAHATFFIYGKLGPEEIGFMREMQSRGHSVGLHGQTHARVKPTIAQKGKDAYWAQDVQPQLDAVKAAGLEVRNFAYPCSDRSEETDEMLGAQFRRLRSGHIFRRNPEKDPLSTLDAAFLPREGVSARRLLNGMGVGSYFPSIADDLEKGLDRLATRNEVLVLYTHDVKPTGDGHPNNTSLDVLERVLKRASELGVDVLGFDEIH